MSILRRLFTAFSGSGGRRRSRGRSSGGGLMSIVSRFLGNSRGRSRSRF